MPSICIIYIIILAFIKWCLLCSYCVWLFLWPCGGSAVVKTLPANTGDARDRSLFPRSGRSPGEGNDNHSSILGWKIPWTEERCGLQSIRLQRVRYNWETEHTHVDCSPPGSSVHGILQARILDWVAISFSRGFSWSRDPASPALAGRFFITEPSVKWNESESHSVVSYSLWPHWLLQSMEFSRAEYWSA